MPVLVREFRPAETDSVVVWHSVKAPPSPQLKEIDPQTQLERAQNTTDSKFLLRELFGGGAGCPHHVFHNCQLPLLGQNGSHTFYATNSNGGGGGAFSLSVFLSDFLPPFLPFSSVGRSTNWKLHTIAISCLSATVKLYTSFSYRARLRNAVGVAQEHA